MRVVLASGNQHKLTELGSALPRSIELIPQQHFEIEDADETGTTFVENAIIKARHASKISQLPAIADDSGIEVDFLHGAPGILSARYAGVNATDQENNRKLLTALDGVPEHQRRARFQCVIVFMRHWTDATPLIASGTWEGLIVTRQQGNAGFGYDPIFYIDALKKTSAELSAQQKNTLSHRGQAVAELARLLNINV